MRYGTIVQYFPDRLYGFIRPDVGPDIFFHISTLDASEGQPEIKVGQAVKYEIMPRAEAAAQNRSASGNDRTADRGRRQRPRAKLVELIDQIPGATLAEGDGTPPPARHPRARKKKPTWRR